MRAMGWREWTLVVVLLVPLAIINHYKPTRTPKNPVTLDELYPHGFHERDLALPPDPELLADLTAPRYELRVSGVAVESKEDIRDRIGRSTDAGDAVGLACWRGQGEVSFSGW